MQLFSSLLMLGGGAFLSAYGPQLLSACTAYLGNVVERGMLLMFPPMDLLLVAAPQQAAPMLLPFLQVGGWFLACLARGSRGYRHYRTCLVLCNHRACSRLARIPASKSSQHAVTNATVLIPACCGGFFAAVPSLTAAAGCDAQRQ